jgi:hypothetical protein
MGDRPEDGRLVRYLEHRVPGSRWGDAIRASAGRVCALPRTLGEQPDIWTRATGAARISQAVPARVRVRRP